MLLRNDIGVVVLNYNSADQTRICCTLLSECIAAENIIVVDNCSTLSDLGDLSVFCSSKGYFIIENEKNGGYSAGNNLGIQKLLARGIELILVCNPDVLITADSLNRIAKQLKADEGALFAGPKIISPEGEIDECAQTFKPWDFKAVLCSKYPLSKLGLFGLKAKYFKCHRNFDLVESAFTVSGCCVMFKAEYFDLFDLFDEDFFLYNEEVVWGHNALSEGFHALYVGEASAIHDHPKRQEATKPNTVINRMRSNMIYLNKYLHSSMVQKRLLALYYTAAFRYLSRSNDGYTEKIEEFISMRNRLVRADGAEE